MAYKRSASEEYVQRTVQAAIQAAAQDGGGGASLDPTTIMSGQELKTNTPNSMRMAIKAIGQALGATVSAVALCAMPARGASVQSAPLGGLDLDSAEVVTNVSLQGLAGQSDVEAASAAASAADAKATTAIAYLQGDDAKVVITNYDSSVHMPSMSFQQRVEEDGSNVWRIVWNELTRWNWLTGTYLPTNYYGKTQIDALLDGKADRAWGFYDSHTGNYAPDGYTWVSSPKIAIAAGLAYQRTVTTEGAVWVLVSNGLVTETGGTVSNGFFRISDDENNALFEIVKGNKRTIGAQAEQPAITNVMGIAHMYIRYNVVSESFPKLKICTDLSAANWQDEDSADCAANVDWSGTSGAYVAEVWGKTAQPRMFVKAEYEVGGETYIKNAAPISVHGGILCTDGIHKVRPVYNNGNITWEVVP